MTPAGLFGSMEGRLPLFGLTVIVLKLLLPAAVLFLSDPLAAEMSSEQWESLRTLLRSHAEEGWSREAIRIAETALSAVAAEMGDGHPQAVFLLSELTTLHWQAGDPETAKSYAGRLEKLEEKPYEACMVLGEHHERLEEFKTAEAFYKKACRLEPRRTDAVVKLAQISGLQGRGETAVKLLRKALRRNPANYGLSLELAKTYISLGRIREAGELLERLRREHPEDTHLLIEIGYFHLNHGNTDAAEAVFREVGGMDKARGYHHMAQYFWDTGHLKEAASYFERALEEMADPAFDDDFQHLHTMDHLASLYHQLGKREEVEDLAKRALSKEWGWRNDLMWAGLLSFPGIVYLQLGKPAEAARVYRAVLERAERNNTPPEIRASLLTRLGDAALQGGRSGEARSRLLEAASIWEKSLLWQGKTEYLDELARLLQKIDEPARAEALFKRILQVGPTLHRFGNPALRFLETQLQLADLWFSQERFAEAEDGYRQALALAEKLSSLHDRRADVLLRLAELLDRQGRAQEAEEVRARAGARTPRTEK